MICTYVITDAGTPYQVIVVAFTNAGRGIESYPKLFFTKELVPSKPPQNVLYKRSGTNISVSWDPLTLIEARGFPIYIVTLLPLSITGSRDVRQSTDGRITPVITNKTDAVIEGLDPYGDYSLTIAVRTSSGQTATTGVYIVSYSNNINTDVEKRVGNICKVSLTFDPKCLNKSWIAILLVMYHFL